MSLARTTALLATLAACLALAACGSSSDQETGAPAGMTEGETSSTAPQEERGEGASPPASEAPVGVTAKSCTGAPTVGGVVRVTGASCAVARRTVAAWARSGACSPPGTSRSSCKLGDLTCLGALTDSGLAVTCATVGRSIVFLARRG